MQWRAQEVRDVRYMEHLLGKVELVSRGSSRETRVGYK
jgi:hypothetical protein